jgi:hypothetical protein
LDQPEKQGIRIGFIDATQEALGDGAQNFSGPIGVIDANHTGWNSLFVIENEQVRAAGASFRLLWNTNQWGLFKIPTVKFPTSVYPNQVFHPWTAVWDEKNQPDSPRPDALPDNQYAVRVVAKINGAARLQVGVDYYAPPGTAPYCAPWNKNSENCEGAVSNWQCASKGWVTLIAGAPGIFQP